MINLRTKDFLKRNNDYTISYFRRVEFGQSLLIFQICTAKQTRRAAWSLGHYRYHRLHYLMNNKVPVEETHDDNSIIIRTETRDVIFRYGTTKVLYTFHTTRKYLLSLYLITRT
jgi:hypothetical protein